MARRSYSNNRDYSNNYHSVRNSGSAFSSNKPSYGCILLFGPPGCGKTYFLKSTANQYRLPYELIQCKHLKEDLIEGVKTQMFFKKLFSRARERAPSMIILDNIDEITSVRSLKDVKIRKAVYQLLRELERIKPGDRLLVTAATNKPYLIEPLLFKAKRFDKLLYVPGPELESRQKLFDLFLKRFRVDDDINMKILGRITKGYSGWDIRKAVKAARQLARRDGVRGIAMHHLESAVSRIRPSLRPEILEPIKHFFVRNKKGLIGVEGDRFHEDREDQEYQEFDEPQDGVDYDMDEEDWVEDGSDSGFRISSDDEPDWSLDLDDEEGEVESVNDVEIDWSEGSFDEGAQNGESAEEEDDIEHEDDAVAEENEDDEAIDEKDTDDVDDEDEVEDWDNDNNNK